MQLPKVLRYHKDEKSEEFKGLVHNEDLPNIDSRIEVRSTNTSDIRSVNTVSLEMLAITFLLISCIHCFTKPKPQTSWLLAGKFKLQFFSVIENSQNKKYNMVAVHKLRCVFVNIGLVFLHYENLPLQYMEIFSKAKHENFIGKFLLFLIFFLKTRVPTIYVLEQK